MGNGCVRVDFGELMTLLFVTSGKVGKKQQANLTPLLNGGNGDTIRYIYEVRILFRSQSSHSKWNLHMLLPFANSHKPALLNTEAAN